MQLRDENIPRYCLSVDAQREFGSEGETCFKIRGSQQDLLIGPDVIKTWPLNGSRDQRPAGLVVVVEEW